MDFFVPQVSEEEISRQKEKARRIRASQWWKQKRSKGVCHYCGGRFRPNELTMDHIVPIVRGGMSTKGNLVPACKECNNTKKYMLPIEWEQYLERLGRD
jgi:5-methylcytosine-specific restriction endonuclease McrA